MNISIPFRNHFVSDKISRRDDLDGRNVAALLSGRCQRKKQWLQQEATETCQHEISHLQHAPAPRLMRSSTPPCVVL